MKYYLEAAVEKVILDRVTLVVEAPYLDEAILRAEEAIKENGVTPEVRNMYVEDREVIQVDVIKIVQQEPEDFEEDE